MGSSIRANDLKKLNKLIKKVGSVLGTPLEPLEMISQRRRLWTTVSILCRGLMNNKVSSVRGFSRSGGRQTTTEDPSCLQHQHLQQLVKMKPYELLQHLISLLD